MRTASPRSDTRSPQQLLAQLHTAGRSGDIDERTVAAALRSLVAAEAGALWGLAPFPSLTYEAACRAARAVYGWPDERPVPTIAPAATLEATARAAAVIAAAAARGDRVACATARPASLLPLLQRVGAVARRAGAVVVTSEETGEFRSEGRAGRRIWWARGVATVTDGVNLLAVGGTEAASEWLFLIPRPDLVVADHGFAGQAIREGIPAVVFADVDTPVFAVAAAHGAGCTVVPVHDRLPPAAYEPLETVIAEALTAAAGTVI